jgi:NADH dehydrogenase [ubiquinone] 1 alpha subcomplex assembly factor 7
MPLSPRTPLLKELELRIRVRGPISISEFMRVCLTHPLHGYYTHTTTTTNNNNNNSSTSKNNKINNTTRKIFGVKGDFTTSPEISQLFGEMIGIWCVDTWTKLGSPQQFNLCELGPGRGTLMKDILRTIQAFPQTRDALSSVHFIEASKPLQNEQLSSIKSFSFMNKNQIKFHSSLHEFHNKQQQQHLLPTLFIAQEFLDALPIHQFEYIKDRGWCERLVDVVDSVPDISAAATATTATDLQGLTHHLRFVLSKTPTPASKLLLGDTHPTNTSVVNRIEIGIDAMCIVQDIARIINRVGGACLLVDYGVNNNNNPADSLRGILNHEFVHPLREPGLVDLSVDVNFNALKRVLQYERVGVIGGPTTQGQFLKTMGIEHRLGRLLHLLGPQREEEQLKLYVGYKRLVDPGEMGNSYKVLGFGSKPNLVMDMEKEREIFVQSSAASSSSTNVNSNNINFPQQDILSLVNHQQPSSTRHHIPNNNNKETNNNQNSIVFDEIRSGKVRMPWGDHHHHATINSSSISAGSSNSNSVNNKKDDNQNYSEFTKKFGFEMVGF